MKRFCLFLITLLIVILVSASWAAAAGKVVQINVDGQDLILDPPPFIAENRVFVPLRAVAEFLGTDVTWDASSHTASIYKKKVDQGEVYLQGLYNQTDGQPGIKRNFISATTLLELLDDDNDGDLVDYRQGHNSGDIINNDPLVIDVRDSCDYESAHIPGAVWIAEAAAMGNKENERKLLKHLENHVAKGGKNEIVIYCYTGHTASLVAGVLGARGLNVKTLAYGFDIAWTGQQTAPAPIRAPIEDKDGEIYTSTGG